ncbi:MAG: BREX system Lon protease-like protein BrxL [Clostridia bacterium]|nr:BREX system Lon protease-like protein BrxL [Clostridia bacterium]
MSELANKLQESFDGMIVKKSSMQNVFSSLNLPAFIRDWFLKKYADKDGNVNVNFVLAKIKDVMPRKDEWNALLDKMLSGERVKFLAKIQIDIDIKTEEITFAIPDFGVTTKQTYIPKSVWDKHKKEMLVTDGEFWGILDLEYRQVQSGKKQEGKISLVDFKDFRPYKIDLNFFKNARKNFTIEEWIDVLLGAIDYNAQGFKSETEKLTMLTRLLPFVEERLNLMELAPKGTGKSYIFSQISKKGWLVSGGVMTRAKMFYDMNKHQDGLVSYYDYVALDEISTIKFPDIDEMRGAMKGYLESGTYNVGNKAGSGKAGVVLLGNIREEKMDVNNNMLDELPPLFEDSALIDRFHGFIKGWDVPRMNEDMKVNDWALNTEYFSEIMHALREDVIEKAIVDALIEVPKDADTRDTKAIKRIATAYVKLFFPHWASVDDVNKEEFKKYCLDRAIEMRGIIKTQLGIMDTEFKKRPMQEFRLKGE